VRRTLYMWEKKQDKIKNCHNKKKKNFLKGKRSAARGFNTVEEEEKKIAKKPQKYKSKRGISKKLGTKQHVQQESGGGAA